MVNAGATIDLLLTWPNGEHWAIAVKRGTTPNTERGFDSVCDDLKPVKKWAIYTGTEAYPLHDDTSDAFACCVAGTGGLARGLKPGFNAKFASFAYGSGVNSYLNSSNSVTGVMVTHIHRDDLLVLNQQLQRDAVRQVDGDRMQTLKLTSQGKIGRAHV